MMLCLNISVIAVINIKVVDYRCFILEISKSKAIHLLKNYALKDRRYIQKCIPASRIESIDILKI